MTQAKALLCEISDELSSREAELRQHRYPVAFRDGKLPLKAIVPFLSHQYHIANSDIQSVALMVHHFGDTALSEFFRELLEGEYAGRSGILAMSQKLGLREEDLQATEPRADGFAYATYFHWLASLGTAAAVMSGLLLNLAAWGHNCGQLSQGLREHHGWQKEDTTFLDAFAELPSFEDIALPVIQTAIDHGEPIQHIKRAVRLIQDYEGMFWDAMADEAGL